ncbi:transporter substrate-binding domain-containing protein [Magnetovibrio sp.]|uniref:substrate-binding periplasmic protein n=1 Tax=Magnetovibrio sp. TaxID=2024836 RepID=UPI002F95CAE6
MPLAATSNAYAKEMADSPPDSSAPILVCTNQTNAIHQIAADFIVEAYKRIGRNVEFVDLPNRRSLMLANEGDCDAETIRIADMGKTYPNLIAVPVIVTELQAVAFMGHDDKTDHSLINDWKDIQGLETAIINGEIYAERNTANMSVSKVRTYTQLFTMLEQGRIDVAIGIRRVGLVERSRNFPNASFHVHGAPLLRAPMYHYIHRKNTHLLRPLTEVLNAMRASGELDALNAQALDRLMSQP